MLELHLGRISKSRCSIHQFLFALAWWSLSRYWNGASINLGFRVTTTMIGLLPTWVGHLAWAKNTPLLGMSSLRTVEGCLVMAHPPAYPGWYSGKAGIRTQEVYLQSPRSKPVCYATSPVWGIASTLKELIIWWENGHTCGISQMRGLSRTWWI